jgi:uncharacterized membrane protein YphA (DoxX/SURF4 family)
MQAILLQYFVAIVFISAGIVRLLLPQENHAEQQRLYKELSTAHYVVAIAECILGVMLLTSRFARLGLVLATIGVVVFTILVVIRTPHLLIDTWKDIFTYQSTCSSVLMHVCLIVMCLALIM